MSRLTDKQAEIAMGRCFHFHGVHTPRCDAGVSHELFTGSLPCLKSFDQGKYTCHQRRWHTREEVEAEHAESEAHSAVLNQALPIVGECKAMCAETGRSHFIRICPACRGKLTIGIAISNLHARVRCEKPGCISWIE